MITELSRLVVGLILLGFHRQIATWILRQEEQLARVMASKGWYMPQMPTEKTVHDVYFWLGVFICCFSLVRLAFLA